MQQALPLATSRYSPPCDPPPLAQARLQHQQDEAELLHLKALREGLQIEGHEMAQLLVAKAQGAPSKLIQIAHGMSDRVFRLSETAE